MGRGRQIQKFVVSDDEMEKRTLPSSSGDTFDEMSNEDQQELVKRLIRYMVCRNAKRKPVRRADLSKYVLANHEDARSKARIFNATLEAARKDLDANFGFRIVEVYKKTRPNPTAASSTKQSQSQSEGAGFSKAYIIVSTLSSQARPENKRDWATFGFLTVVAAIISLTPEVRIEEDALYRSLERLGTIVKESRGHAQLNGGNVKEFIENVLVSQWYLERAKEDDAWWYKIGPRLWAELEFSDLIMFIEAVYKEGGAGSTGIDENAKKELTSKLEDAMVECLGVDE